MRNPGSLIAVAIAGAVLCSLPAYGQTPVFYPAKKQTAQQQSKDTGECNTWAKQTTGIDPKAPAPAGPSGPAVGGGERVRGAARGAVVGGALGDAGAGAAVGAVAGGARARQNQASQQQAASAASAEQKNTYYRAVGACMEGRGYTVK